MREGGAVIAITAPLPHIRDARGNLLGQRIVVMTQPGSMRIQRCETFGQAEAVEKAWRAGNFKYWPGEVRPLPGAVPCTPPPA